MTDWHGQDKHDEFDRLLNVIEAIVPRVAIASALVATTPERGSASPAVSNEPISALIYIGACEGDRDAAERLRDAIMRFGAINVLLPRVVIGGMERGWILQQIWSETTTFLLVVSERLMIASDDDFVFAALDTALDVYASLANYQLFIVPIAVDKNREAPLKWVTDRFPALQRVQYIEALDGDLDDRARRRLSETIDLRRQVPEP